MLRHPGGCQASGVEEVALNLVISTYSNWNLVIRCDISGRAEYKTRMWGQGQTSSAVIPQLVLYFILAWISKNPDIDLDQMVIPVFLGSKAAH